MNLNTIKELRRPKSFDEIASWHEGCAWLAGGTWLFSEPQVTTHTLVDLETLGWPALQVSDQGLEIAATCRIAELYAFEPPAAWTTGPLFGECCRSFLSSFKIWNEATVGGNICMALPAGPMISLTVALEGVYTLWPRTAPARNIPAVDFVTDNHHNILAPGELLRSIQLPVSALTKRFAFRRSSMTHLGRSAVLLIATSSPQTHDFLLTITASTVRPVQLHFEKVPAAAELREAIEHAVPDELYLDDVNSSPPHRRHVTYYFAERIRQELSA
jgi:CO/xanthine dehydrogenase FAD-binding subunit